MLSCVQLKKLTMGNSSFGSSATHVNCFDPNLSRNSVSAEFWDVHAVSSDFTASSLATATIMLLFILVGAPSNIMIIVSIIQQKLYMETTHILLLNLAISDVMVCLLVMPFVVVTGFSGEYIFGESDYIRCQVCQTGIIFIGLTVFSVNILAVITLDRFIVIRYPLRHDHFITAPRVVIVVIALWMISIFQCVLPLFGFGAITFAFSFATCVFSMNNSYAIFVVALALIPIAVTIFFNIWLACIVSKQIKIVYRTRRTFGNKEELRQYNEGLRKQIHKRKNKKQLVLVRAFGAILLSNIIVWMPLVLHTIILLFADPDILPLGLYSFVFVSFIMHSVLHPLIEACFIPEIRKTFKTVLGISFFKKQLIKLKKKAKGEERKVSITSTTQFELYTDEEPRGCFRGCCELCTVAAIPESLEAQDVI